MNLLVHLLWVVLLLALPPASYAQTVRTTTAENGTVSVTFFEGVGDLNSLPMSRRSELKRIPAIDCLTLHNHVISNSELEFVASLTNVNRLQIGTLGLRFPDQAKIDNGTWNKLKSMPWLEELHVNLVNSKDFAPFTDSELNWGFLQGMDRLTCLRLDEDNTIGDGFVNAVSGCKSLEILEIHAHSLPSKEILWKLGKLTSLRSIRLFSDHLTDDTATWIVRLTNLEEVRLFGQMSSEAINYLHFAKNLAVLDVTLNGEITKESMEEIATHRKLKFLRLRGGQIDDIALSELSGLPLIEELHLENAKLSEKSLQTLHSLRKLKVVSLTGNSEAERISTEFNRALAKEDKK